MEPSVWTDEDIFLVAERAHALYQQGCHREAAVLFEGLTTVDPRNAYCHDALAAVYMALGQPQQAVLSATNALRIAPKQADSLARRCEAYMMLRMFPEAGLDLEALRRGGAPHYKRLQLKLRQAAATATNPSPNR
jgi:tetratricopeptide (TPR) repeat protein